MLWREVRRRLMGEEEKGLPRKSWRGGGLGIQKGS